MKIVGLVEKVKVIGDAEACILAVCDTGAGHTSVDLKLAKKAKLGPTLRTMKIKNPSLKGHVNRPVVRAIIELGRKKFDVQVNLQDRSHMKFPVIIGRDVLMGNFMVDAKKNFNIWKKKRPSSEELNMSLDHFVEGKNGKE